MQKDNILILSRELISKKGLDYLSVRKISAYVDISVGYFYGRFPHINDFIDAQNNITLSEMLKDLKSINKSTIAYDNVNKMADCFISYAKANSVLWSLLSKSLSWQSSKQIAAIIRYIDKEVASLLPKMPAKKRKVSTRLIVVSMFSVSNLLIQRPQDIKALLNTYIAGLKVLEAC